MNFKQVSIGLFVIIVVLQSISLYNTYFTPTVVYVDSSQLLENYEGMKVARQAFQQKAAQWQANIDTLKLELDREIKKYESEKKNMSAKERELNEKLIGTKRQ
ncbi:MAG: OmpH family outer membrane protein, partial [Bacteroidota bacterium]